MRSPFDFLFLFQNKKKNSLHNLNKPFFKKGSRIDLQKSTQFY